MKDEKKEKEISDKPISGEEVKKILDTKDVEEKTREDLEEEVIEEMEEKEKEKPITEKIVKKVEEKPKPKPKPKPLPPPVKKVENRNIPCILRFKKVTAKQAANVAKLFRKLKYTNYTIVHSKGHNEWDILVRFDNLDERDKFEKIINKLL